jgi:hypothetical protein
MKVTFDNGESLEKNTELVVTKAMTGVVNTTTTGWNVIKAIGKGVSNAINKRVGNDDAQQQIDELKAMIAELKNK